jgi:hypothetical protein
VVDELAQRLSIVRQTHLPRWIDVEALDPRGRGDDGHDARLGPLHARLGAEQRTSSLRFGEQPPNRETIEDKSRTHDRSLSGAHGRRNIVSASR